MSAARRTTLTHQHDEYAVVDLQQLSSSSWQHLPTVYKILLENCLRCASSAEEGLDACGRILQFAESGGESCEIYFRPARVLLQDFTGVPAVVDLAAMRDAMSALGGHPDAINPLIPVELVIDHSVQVDHFKQGALDLNTQIEFQRNQERYHFLRWGQQAFKNFKVVPPGTGIVHQVNLEYLARVVFNATDGEQSLLYPDTVVGTDSHTTMINALGVLGWGVGGIEAEAAMLGQPISMLIPEVVGFELTGQLVAGITATDLVLVITQMLREHGVVGKFVEFYGDGLDHLSLADRATIANMAPEYGATCGFFPVDSETIAYLRLTGRDENQVSLVEAYCRAQGLWRESGAPHAHYRDSLRLDLSQVVASIAGPKRPQDRLRLPEAKTCLQSVLPKEAVKTHTGVQHGSVVIAAITSCTNTSNPSVMLAAGLLAKAACARGLTVPGWVKTSLAPGSGVVTDYLNQAGLIEPLAQLGFHVVGYGCTTCIGNSGPLPEAVSSDIQAHQLHVCSVLSGNRNFEGRIHPEVRSNFLASPPLVLAYALAGRMDIDLTCEPLGVGTDGQPVFLADIWPDEEALRQLVQTVLQPAMFRKRYASVFEGDATWRDMPVPEGSQFAWRDESTYIQHPPYFEGIRMEPSEPGDILAARALAVLGDSITTDHISPAGAIKPDSPAGDYLQQHGVQVADFNSYGSRRGNHEVMVRGTLANVRLRNLLVPGVEGGVTRLTRDASPKSIHEAAMAFAKQSTPLIIIAGREYGTGSSRDWAAKGVRLLGVRAVIAESYERIHRSNLIGMGVLPLQFLPGQNQERLGITGFESFDLTGIMAQPAHRVQVRATEGDKVVQFELLARLDTPQEVAYYRHGGILQYVLRQICRGGM